MPVDGAPVGVASELAVVGQPGVGPFHGPAQAEEQGSLPGDLRFAAATSVGDDGVIDVACGEVVADGVGVVAAVQVQRFDVEVQTSGGEGVEGRGEQADVVAIGAVDGPSDSRSALRGEASADLAVPAFSGAHGLQGQRFELVGEVA